MLRRLLLLTVLFSPAGSLADFYDGNKLYRELQYHARVDSGQTVSDKEWFDLATARGYVTGVADAREGSQFCLPPTATLGQVVDITLNHLRAFPEMRHQAGSRLVVAALAKAFPCAK